MRHDARIAATCTSPTDAEQLRRSLAPEAAALVDDRSRTTVSRSREKLHVTIEAGDLVALRAALNTWFGLLRVAESVAELDGPAGTG